MPTTVSRTPPASQPAPRPKGTRALAHAVLDRALRGVRKELRRLEQRNVAVEENLADQVEGLNVALNAVRMKVARLADALIAADERRESDRADLVRRTGDLTRALVEQSRGGVSRAAVVEPVIDAVIDRELSDLDRRFLRELADVALEAETAGLPGIIVETGCALGGSALVLGAAKAPERPLRVYGSAGLIAPEQDGDETGEPEGEEGETGEDDVRRAFADLGVQPRATAITFVEERFEDTVDADDPVAVAHLDGDGYEATLASLERLGPRIVPGGRVVLGEYDSWEECRRAVDEWLVQHPEFRQERRGRLHLVRRAD